MQFNERLRITREDKKLTQMQISSSLSIQLRQYQRYEYGENDPTSKVLVALADVLEVSTDYLLCRTENPEINK